MRMLVKDCTTDKQMNFNANDFFFANVVSKENDKSISVILRTPKEQDEAGYDIVCILERIK